MTPEQQQAIEEATAIRDAKKAQQGFTPQQLMAIETTKRQMQQQCRRMCHPRELCNRTAAKVFRLGSR